MLYGDISSRLSTATVVDDFDDGDVSEYSGDTGDSGLSVQQNTVQSGTHALEFLNTSSTYVEILSTSGLDNYISKGSEFHFHWRTSEVDADVDQARMFFGLDNTTDSSDCFYIRMDCNSEDIVLIRRDDTDGNSVLASAADPIGIATATWYRTEVVWDDNSGTLTGTADNITIDTIDTSDSSNLHSTLSATSTYHSSQSGIGWAANQWDQTGEAFYFDSCTIENTA